VHRERLSAFLSSPAAGEALDDESKTFLGRLIAAASGGSYGRVRSLPGSIVVSASLASHGLVMVDRALGDI
jgi:hypothetical protein